MKELAKKVLKAGFGLGLLSLEQAKKTAQKVKQELQLSEEESKKLARQLIKSSREAAEDVLNVVGKNLEEVVVKSGVARKGELKMLRKTLTKRASKAWKKSFRRH